MDDISDHIGERLLEARGKAGLTVDDVMFKTRIPRSVIVALEAGDFSVFSSPTYAKSFLSQYSDFLSVDAGIWLDALQPASFISGESINPLWEMASPRKEEVTQEREPTGGWVSAVSLLAISCGLVYAAIKGYEFFEARFGVDLVTSPATLEVADSSESVAPAAPATMRDEAPRSVEEPRPLVKNSEPDFIQPPPRAIVVRP